MEVIYRPKKPKYLVYRDEDLNEGYDNYVEAVEQADLLQKLFPMSNVVVMKQEENN